MNIFNIKHCWKNYPVNIGHFFHDVIFHGISEYIYNNKIIWILDDDLSEWEKEITMLMINYLKINYKIGNNTSFHKYNRDIKIDRHFNEVIKLVHKAIYNKFTNIVIPDSYKVLYFRNDASRRKMLNYNNELNNHFETFLSILN